MRRFLKKQYWIALLIVSGTSCSPDLKPYERIYVNDPEMQMITETEKSYQHYVHSIREGAITPLAKKGNGGCGCN